jgi:hypothetical protein
MTTTFLAGRKRAAKEGSVEDVFRSKTVRESRKRRSITAIPMKAD